MPARAAAQPSRLEEEAPAWSPPSANRWANLLGDVIAAHNICRLSDAALRARLGGGVATALIVSDSLREAYEAIDGAAEALLQAEQRVVAAAMEPAP